MQVLYLEIQQVIDNARAISGYRSGTETGHGEQNPAPSINIEDNALSKKLLEDGAAEVAGIMSGYFKGLAGKDSKGPEGFEFDADYEGKEGCIVYRLNMPPSYDARLNSPLKRAVRSALENFILFRFSDMVNSDSGKYEGSYRKELGKIRSYLSRRTETIKRTYKLY